MEEKMADYMEKMMEEKARQMNEPKITDVGNENPEQDRRNDMSREEIEKKTEEMFARLRTEPKNKPAAEPTPPKPTPTVRRSSRTVKPVNKLNLMVNSQEEEEGTSAATNTNQQSMDQLIVDRMREMEERLRTKE